MFKEPTAHVASQTDSRAATVSFQVSDLLWLIYTKIIFKSSALTNWLPSAPATEELFKLQVNEQLMRTNSQTFFSGDVLFMLSCGIDESSFRFLDGCSVALPFRFPLSFRLFSFPCSDSSSSYASVLPFSSGSSDLCEERKK